MTDSQQNTATLADMGSDIKQSLQEAIHQSKPALGMMAERVSERLHDLAHQGKEAALETQHKIENQARQVKSTAEHYIQHAPFKSVMVAAGVGLLAGVITTWLMRERNH